MKLVISIIVFAIMLFVFISVRLSENVTITQHMVNHTRDIVVHTQKLLQVAFDNESGSRAYVITGDKKFLEPFQNSEKDFSDHLEKLSALVEDDKVEKNLTDSLRFYFSKRVQLTNEMLLLRNRNDIQAATALVAAGNGLILGNKIRFFGDEIIRIENELLDKRRNDHDQTLAQLKGFLYGMIALAFLLSIGFLLIIQKDFNKKEKLRNEVNELALMMEESSEAIFSRSPDQIITRWNKGAEKLFGYSKVEAIGKTPWKLGFIKMMPEEITWIENQVLQQGFSKSDRIFYHKNGSRFFGSVTANAIKDDQGKPKSFYFIVKDISAHKELQEALATSNEELEAKVKERTAAIIKNESRFRSLVENNYDIISVLDESLKIAYRSPSAERIMGWTENEMKVLEGMDNVHPNDREYAAAIIDFAKNNPGKKVDAAFRRKHKNGHYVWLEGVITNMLHDPVIQGYITNFRDVTDKVEAEKKLVSSEKRFRALLENNNDIISLMDDSFGIVYRSPAAARITGWTDEEMKSISGIRNIHPDDQPYAREIVQEVMASPGKPINTTFRNLHKQGHYLWVEGTLTNLLHDENIKAIVFNFRDVTARITAADKLARSELLFRSVIENISEGISMSDENFNPIFRSPAAKILLGEIGSKRGANLIHPDDRKTIINKQAESLQNPGAIVPFEGRFLNTEDEYVWIEGEIINMLALDGVNAIISNYRNITNRKIAEQKLVELNTTLEDKIEQRTAQLKKANEEMDAFTYSVSHDLRAPLRGIIGFTKILEEEYTSQLDDEAKRISAVIASNAMSMGQLIDDLLSFSRIGKQEISKTEINTSVLVQEVIAGQLRLHPENNNISWNTSPLEDTFGDTSAIRQVWVNLVSNAIKYSAKKEKPAIEIGSYRQNGNAVFFIKDNGVGFDEKYKDKLFKVFQRLHSSAEFEGTGVGLALVEKVISRHGGSICAEGKINEGACFTFSVPREENKAS